MSTSFAGKYLKTVSFGFFSAHGKDGKKRAKLLRELIQNARTNDSITLLTFGILQFTESSTIITSTSIGHFILAEIIKSDALNKKILSFIQEFFSTNTLYFLKTLTKLNDSNCVLYYLYNFSKDLEVPNAYTEFKTAVRTIRLCLKNDILGGHYINEMLSIFSFKDLAKSSQDNPTIIALNKANRSVEEFNQRLIDIELKGADYN
jgi:hypothetical protein